jgi:uncharacterized protein (DUF1501 family)
VAPWGRKAEAMLDAAYRDSRQAFMAQAVDDFISDKANGDAHVVQLVNPALHLATPPPAGTPSPSLGMLADGSGPLTNDMLAEVFGLDTAHTPPGDVFLDVFGALQDTQAPTWKLTDNAFGLNAAVAVRLLQIGAPVVSVSVGSFDTHSYEVIDPQNKRPQTAQIVSLARVLAGLEFVLQRIADPVAAGKTLWDSTVVFLCSEFGRGGGNIGPNGFNSPSGQNDGGSDHDPWSAWPVMGGPVLGRGQLLVDAGGAPAARGFFQQNRVFTSILSAMGIDDANNPYLPYGTFPPIPGLLHA